MILPEFIFLYGVGILVTLLYIDRSIFPGVFGCSKETEALNAEHSESITGLSILMFVFFPASLSIIALLIAFNFLCYCINTLDEIRKHKEQKSNLFEDEN